MRANELQVGQLFVGAVAEEVFDTRAWRQRMVAGIPAHISVLDASAAAGVVVEVILPDPADNETARLHLQRMIDLPQGHPLSADGDRVRWIAGRKLRSEVQIVDFGMTT